VQILKEKQRENGNIKSSQEEFKLGSMSVLVLGVYLSDQKDNMVPIVENFNSPGQWHVMQKWASIATEAPSEDVKKVTVLELQHGLPKFILLNKLLSEEVLDYYDFVIVCDDDVSLPPDFLTSYLELVIHYDFALAQPARTPDSFIDHHFVQQMAGLRARQTRFVEIGPLFSVRRDFFSTIFPFDERSYMGWGYDFVWPCLIEKQGLKMGIIDAIPVEHRLRKPVKHYNYDKADKSEKDYLSRNPHLSWDEAFRILKSFT
jgi:hypothetical protein